MKMEEVRNLKKEIMGKIDAWHNSDTENNLVDFLGWTSEEYKEWLEKNELPQRELKRLSNDG